MIIASYNDKRIPISDEGKYIAQFQSFNAQNGLICINDYNQWHAASSDVTDLYARIFGFLYESLSKK